MVEESSYFLKDCSMVQISKGIMKRLWNALYLHIGTYLKSYLLINKMLFLTATPTYFDWRVKAKKGFLH